MADISNNKLNDISYKHMPVSVFDVAKMGKKGIRGKRNWSTKNKKSIPSSRSTYSPFPPDVAEWCAQYFLRDKQNIFDPFAGWGERHRAIKDASKNYIGYDISEKAIANAKEKFGVDNILANSMTAEIPEHDGLLTCPPYWNLEKYESKEGLDRIKEWKDFLIDYEKLWKHVSEKALPGARYCIMVGDWRKKNIFYDFGYQTEKVMETCGFKPFDKVILSHKKISPIKLMLPQAKRFGYTPKVHQYLYIYEKC